MSVKDAGSTFTETNRIRAELVVCFETKTNEISVPGKGGVFLLSYPNSKKRYLCNLKMSEAYKAFLNIDSSKG
jgi:hypothetical protein